MKNKSEHQVKTEIRKDPAIGSNPCIKLFNYVVGHFWAGTPVLETGLRRETIGQPGVADLVGWRTIIITQEMVGKKFAQFVAIETKKPVGGKEGEHQKGFIELVKEAGGLAGFARSVADALRILQLA